LFFLERGGDEAGGFGTVGFRERVGFLGSVEDEAELFGSFGNTVVMRGGFFEV